MPPEQELSRKVAVVIGAASGIGREVALEIAKRGGHVVAADLDADAAARTAADAIAVSSADMTHATAVDSRVTRQSARRDS